MSGHVETENAYRILVGNCEFKRLLGDLCIEVRLILTLVIMTFYKGMASIDLAHGLAAGSCQHGNKSWGS
jgi:hypothetical protein